MKKLNQEEKDQIEALWRAGHNCVQIKEIMSLKGHQQVLNVLKKLDDYEPYKYGRNHERKYSLNEQYFDSIDNEEKAYILGFICADGFIDVVNQRLVFILQTLDEDIMLKIANAMGSNALIKRFIKQSSFNYGKREFYHSKIEFCSKIFTDRLIEMGLDNSKTYSLNSSIMNYVPEIFIRDFIRGYFDGDGSIFYGKNYSSGIKYLIQVAGNLEFLQNTFGKYFPTTNKYYKFPKSLQCYCYKLSSKSNVDKFLESIYKDSKIFLDRKYRQYAQSAHLKVLELLES